MTQDEKKRDSAEAAVARVAPGSIVGVGTGSTTNHFIDCLSRGSRGIEAAVASSEETARRLARGGIRVIELAEAGELPLYVDGADEATRQGRLIKGGGGALTREKVLAAASREFVCIVDDSKIVDRLGRFPLPLEVIPMAAASVARLLRGLGGDPKLREGFTTDNGNQILDVSGLSMEEPTALESELNQIAGVVTVGLFCRRGADLLLVGGEHGVEIVTP
jgi:ribose 5-phosphate isomerase A